jgi:flagellar basal-body rod protein FlgG
MNATERWQDAISQNLAAGSIPGYKKQDVSFATVAAGLMPQGVGQHFGLPRAQISTNFAPGEMRSTNIPTDVAIEGSGFFEVQLPNGSRGYTRDGQFTINSVGQLSTKRGYLVMGNAGPIQIDRGSGGTITISSTGDLSQGSNVKGTIKVVEFNRPDLLMQGSGGYFVANNPAAAATQVASPIIHQGFLEGSNSSSVAEMAHLMTAMRSYEANAKVVQFQDDRMGKAISDLGNPVS